MSDTVRISIEVPAEYRRRLKIVASTRSITIKQIIVEMIDRLYDEYKEEVQKK